MPDLSSFQVTHDVLFGLKVTLCRCPNTKRFRILVASFQQLYRAPSLDNLLIYFCGRIRLTAR